PGRRQRAHAPQFRGGDRRHPVRHRDVAGRQGGHRRAVGVLRGDSRGKRPRPRDLRPWSTIDGGELPPRLRRIPMKDRSAPVILAVVLAAVALVATATWAADPVTIEYWHINSPTFGGPAAKELVQLFESRQPGIKVVEKFQPGVYTGLMQQLQVSLAARRPPAVAQIGYNLTAYAAGQFPPGILDKYPQSDPEFFKGIPDTIVALGQLGGKLHGIPFGVSVPVMYYNPELFKAAGLPVEPPQTWDELQRVGAVIKQKTGKFAVYLQQPND